MKRFLKGLAGVTTLAFLTMLVGAVSGVRWMDKALDTICEWVAGSILLAIGIGMIGVLAYCALGLVVSAIKGEDFKL